jgi:hypothetical protein
MQWEDICEHTPVWAHTSVDTHWEKRTGDAHWKGAGGIYALALVDWIRSALCAVMELDCTAGGELREPEPRSLQWHRLRLCYREGCSQNVCFGCIVSSTAAGLDNNDVVVGLGWDCFVGTGGTRRAASKHQQRRCDKQLNAVYLRTKQL